MAGKALARTVATLLLALGIQDCTAPPSRPALGRAGAAGANVLLVTVDTLRRDRVGVYGNAAGLTPVLDRLAAAGLRYADAFSHAPMTLPAHTSILTGRLPVRHGVRNNGTYRLADEVPTLATVLEGSGYRTGAFVGAFVLDARYGLSRGFGNYDDRYPQTSGATFDFSERRAADVVQAAGDWILSNPPASPWLAWVHLFDPHAPYDAPAEYRQGRSPYDAEVAYADAMVGRLLERLRTGHALDRTLVVVTADHGESLGEHGETTHGLFAYASTLAVPLIVSGHGVGAGVVDGAVGHADLLPTICDLLGVAVPPGLDGRSLVRPPEADRLVYFEALDASLTRDWAPLTGVTSAQWKFIDLPEPELYDLAADAGESNNLAALESSQLKALTAAKAALLSATQSAAPAATVAVADGQAERRLRSLGYVATNSAADRKGSELARRPSAADDPKRLVALNERFNTALSAFNEGHEAEALAGFQSVLSERPDFLSARTSAATLLIARGRAREAVMLLREAPPRQAGSPALLAKLGVALREAGDLSSAAVSLERARATGDENPELANDLGVVYARLGRANDARLLFQELLRLDPKDATTWNNLGVLELSATRPAQAAAAFRHAVEADPARGDAWQGLGAALVEQDRPAAIDAWRRAERLLPRDYDLLFNLGVVLAESPNPSEARPYLERFVREAPRDRYGADVARVETMLRRVKR